MFRNKNNHDPLGFLLTPDYVNRLCFLLFCKYKFSLLLLECDNIRRVRRVEEGREISILKQISVEFLQGCFVNNLAFLQY